MTDLASLASDLPQFFSNNYLVQNFKNNLQLEVLSLTRNMCVYNGHYYINRYHRFMNISVSCVNITCSMF